VSVRAASRISRAIALRRRVGVLPARVGQAVIPVQISFNLRHQGRTFRDGESSQRTRGFLHCLLGAAVSRRAGSRSLACYEHGTGERGPTCKPGPGVRPPWAPPPEGRLGPVRCRYPSVSLTDECPMRRMIPGVRDSHMHLPIRRAAMYGFIPTNRPEPGAHCRQGSRDVPGTVAGRWWQISGDPSHYDPVAGITSEFGAHVLFGGTEHPATQVVVELDIIPEEVTGEQC
jgi:hypothetical protein